MRRVAGMLFGIALIAAASAVRLPAAAQEYPIIEEVVPPPELGRNASIDIARLTWRVAGNDAAAMARTEFDDSSWVARGGVSQELLRNPVAWYRFSFLLAPGWEGLGSRLELGGVEGNVSVYLNGTLVGEMRGETEPPYERRETFSLPASLMLPERNVLALRIAGFGGRAKVGIPRGPVRLLPLSRVYERDDKAIKALQEADQTAARLGGIGSRLEEMGLQAQFARILIASGGQAQQVDAALNAVEIARRATTAAIGAAASSSVAAPGSLAFGRFGRGHHEGLLTATLWPEGFRSASTSADPAPIGGVFGNPAPANYVALEGIAPEGKVVRVVQPIGGRYRLYYPLMYPGFALEPLDATLSIRFDKPMDALWVDRWGIATASAATPARLPWTEPWVLLHDPAGLRPPILIALPSPAQPLRLSKAGDGFAVELPARTIARVCWPTGIAPWAGPPDRAAMTRFRSWADAMVPFSRTAEETPRANSLAVRERFGYLRAGAIPYAPLPPVYGAIVAGGGPITAPRARDLGVPTLAGPLWADRKSADLSYELPLPDTSYRAVPRVEGAGFEAPGELPDPQGGNAMDLAYIRRAEAFGRWTRLSRSGRQALESNGQAQLPRAWGPLAWADTTEPLTGTTYRWTFGQLGSDGRIRGIARPNGLALFGTSLAAGYTGDWSVPAVQWQRLRRAFDWLVFGQDWAWQAPVDTDAGLSGGDERSLEGAYLGAIGLARLADAVSPADAAPARAMAARLAPLGGGRDLLARYARQAGLLQGDAQFAGFTETGIASATGSPVPAATASALTEPPPMALASWAPARLEDFVWKPKVRTLEIKLVLKQPTNRFAVRLECPRPTDVQINGQPADADYDPRSGTLTFAPERATGAQTLVLRF